ncbi:diacylglycerol acyltransferase [Pilobolus umbonatus]|nr:diacylglycerol acyltransferase [Pilobolus umbonatus]
MAATPTTHPPNKVQWAPLKIPIERRIQMVAVLVWTTSIVVTIGFFLYLTRYKFLWPILLAYLTFIFVDKTPEKGGRRIEAFRQMRLWNYFADYFPVKLVKEADLDPSKNYIFGYHPHGIISMGAFANFATEGTGFSKNFPGIVPHLLTLTTNFQLPFYRDFLLSCGLANVSRKSCEYILQSGPGKSITIVVGGASESLHARPGVHELVLKRRLGFIRLAIKQQAQLVPVYAFGENDIYDVVESREGSKLHYYQKKMQTILGFTLPLFHARGIFNYNVGIFPFRRPITTVFGKPIVVPGLEEGQIEPTRDQLLAVQKLYIEELQAIFEKYKDQYAPNRISDLAFMD